MCRQDRYCLIVVDVEGSKDAKSHVHFVQEWRPGQPVFCHYDRGVLVEVLGERVLDIGQGRNRRTMPGDRLGGAVGLGVVP